MNLCRLLLKGSPDHKNLFCTYYEAITVLLHNVYLLNNILYQSKLDSYRKFRCSKFWLFYVWRIYEALDISKFSPYIKLYKGYMDDKLIIWVKKDKKNDKVQLSDFFN
jgi:hypothetical protein